MSLTYPALCLEITTDEDLDLTWSDGTARTTTLPADTYDDIKAIVDYLDTEMSTVNADVSVTLSPTTGKITIADAGAAGTFSVTWSTTDEDLRDLLGADAVDDTGAYSYTLPNQVERAWFPNHAPIDTGDRLRSIGPASHVAPDGTLSREEITSHTVRVVEFDKVAASKVFESDAATNESFESFWVYAVRGTRFTYYTDASVWTSAGTYAVEVGENPDMLDGFTRLSPSVARFTFTLRMVKQ